MPKMKTNSGAKKRLHVTGTGRLLRKKSTARHNLGHKSNKRKRHLGGKHAVHASDADRMLHLLAMK